MGWYARHFDEDEQLWRAVGLLHDFDYERHPTLDKHPQDGAPILREEGYPEEVIEAVLSHAEHLAMPRDTQLKKTLFACDELSGFVHAVGLVRPDRSRGARAEVRQEEAQATIVRGRRAPRRGLRRRGGPRSGPRRAHPQRRRGDAADRRRARLRDDRRRRRRPREPAARRIRHRRQRHGARARVLPKARSRVPRGLGERRTRRGTALRRHALHARHRGLDRVVRLGVATPDRRSLSMAARSAANRPRKSTASTPNFSPRAARSTGSRGTRSGASATRRCRIPTARVDLYAPLPEQQRNRYTAHGPTAPAHQQPTAERDVSVRRGAACAAPMRPVRRGDDRCLLVRPPAARGADPARSGRSRMTTPPLVELRGRLRRLAGRHERDQRCRAAGRR